MKQSEREADHSPLSTAELEVRVAIPPLPLHLPGVVLSVLSSGSVTIIEVKLLFLCLIKHHAFEGVDISSTHSLTSASDEFHTHRLLHPRGNVPRYSLDGRLGGPQFRSGCSNGKENPVLSNPGLPTRSHSLYWLSYSGL